MANKKKVVVIGGPPAPLFPDPVVRKRAPNNSDNFYSEGQVWIDNSAFEAYLLTGFSGGNPQWTAVSGGTGTFTNLNVSGTVTFSAMGLGVLRSTAAGVIGSVNGTNGQLLVAGTGVIPAWASVTSGDGSVTIGVGSNTIDLTVSGATASTFPTDSGTATPSLGATTIAGGTNINTSGAGSTVTINVDNAPTFSGLVTAQAGFTQTAGTTTITSDTNAADAIYLRSNGGVLSTIRIHADQGADTASIHLLSDDGGITIAATTYATDDAINISAPLGGIDVDAGLQINIASAENANDAIVLRASAGGIDLTAVGQDAGDDIDITSASNINLTSTADSASSIYLHANGGVSETIRIHSDLGTGVDSIKLDSDVGGLSLISGLATTDAINITASSGGIDIDGALQVNLTSSEDSASAIRIVASAGGMDIDAVGASGQDINITNTGGSIVLVATETASEAIDINTNGGVDIDASLQIDLTAGQAVSDAIFLEATSGGVTVTAGGAVAGDIGNILLTSTLASILLTANEAVGDAIKLYATAGGISAVASAAIELQAGGVLTLGSFSSAANAITLTCFDAAGGIDVNIGTSGLDLDSTGSLVITSTANSSTAINFTANTGNGGFRVTTAAGGILTQTDGIYQIDSNLAAAVAIAIEAVDAIGGITLDAGSGGILIGISGDCTPISIGDVAPSQARVITVGGGTVIGAYSDTIDIGPDGVSTDAGSSKVVNILSGSTTLGAQTVNVGTGNRVSGTQLVNISTGTGTKTVNAGNADALTTFNIDGTTWINDSINAATNIGTGTSTGGINLGNNNAGYVSIYSGDTIDLNNVGGDILLTSTTGRVTIVADEAVANAISLATAATGGINIDAGTAGMTVDSTDTLTINSATSSSWTVTGALADLDLSSVGGSMTIQASEASATAITINASNAAGGISTSAGTGGYVLDVTNGPITISSGTGAINIANDGAACNIQIGDDTGTKRVTIASGTGDLLMSSTDAITLDAAGLLELNSAGGQISIGNDAVAQNINIGTGGAARVITIGNTTGTSGVDILQGTGGVNIGTSAIASSITIGNGTGATDVSINHGSGQLSLGTNSIAHAIEIGNGIGGTGVSIYAGTGGVNIGTNSIANTTTIGNVTTSTSVQILSGSGGILLNDTPPAISRTTTINGGTVSGAFTDRVDIAPDGVSTSAGALKQVTIGGGNNAVGGTSIAIGAGNVTSGTHSISLSAGAGYSSPSFKSVFIGNSDGLTDFSVLAPKVSGAGASQTLDATRGRVTFTGLTTAAAATETLTVTNSFCSTDTGIMTSLVVVGAEDAQPAIKKVRNGAGSFTLLYKNEGAASLATDLILTFELYKTS
jgi:hypothetical protein